MNNRKELCVEQQVVARNGEEADHEVRAAEHGALPEQGLQRPEDRDDGGDRDDRPGDGAYDADDDLQEDPAHEEQDRDREEAGDERGAGALFLHTSSLVAAEAQGQS